MVEEAQILGGFGDFGPKVAKAMGLQYARDITIDIPLVGPVKVNVELLGDESLERIDWSQLKHAVINVSFAPWRNSVGAYDQELIEECVAYSQSSPSRVFGRDDLKLIVARMSAILDAREVPE